MADDSYQKTILLVEDEAIISMTEAALLKKQGYQVLTAYNALDAVETAASEKIDLILMDIDLGTGKMDGTEAAEIILKERDVPIVFLSSHTEPEIVEKTEKITSYGYIVKNSGDTVLLTSIKMAFRLFAAKREVREREEALKREKKNLKQYIGIIEERKRLDEERNSHLLQLYDKIDDPKNDLFDFVLQASLKVTNSKYGFSGFVNEDETLLTIHRWSTDAFADCSLNKVQIEYPISEAGVWADCIRERKPIIINQYETDAGPTKRGVPDGHVAITRFLCIPVFDGERIVAVGAVANKEIPYDDADADALTLIYDKMWALLKQKEVKKKLQESEEKFSKAFQNSGVLMTISSLEEGMYEEVNEAFLVHTGYSRDEVIGHRSIDLGFISENEREKIKAEIQEKGRAVNLELELRKKSGEIFYCLYNGEVFSVKQDKKLLSIAYDITHLKQTSKELNDSDLRDVMNAEQLQELMDHFYKLTNIGVAIVDMEDNVIVATGWQDICTKFHRVHDQTEKNCKESDLFLSKQVKKGEYLEYKCKNNLWDIATPIMVGEKRIGTLYLGQFFYDDEEVDYSFFTRQAELYGFNKEAYLAALDRVPRWSRERVRTVMKFYSHLAAIISELSFHNINLKRIHSEQERKKNLLRAAVKEKDFLMRELYHRVKNNLAMISSLVQLKSATFTPAVDLSDISSQINAIQIVQEKLFKTKNIAEIELRDYIQEILTTVFSFTEQKVEIINTIRDVSIKTQNAVSIGLIVNELATNAIKYGFTSKKKQFAVDFSEDEPKSLFTLTVSNTGEAFPEDISLDNPGTLGLRLISALTEQLNGTIELKRKPSPVFIIRFPVI